VRSKLTGMTMPLRALTLAALLVVPSVFAAQPTGTANPAPVDSYVCVVDAMTGFSFNKSTERWGVTNFRTDSKLLVTRSKNKNFAWEVKEVGTAVPEAVCEKDFNEFGLLVCSGLADFKFNKTRLRFLYIHSIGYWNDDDKSDLFKEGQNSPVIGIGKCNPSVRDSH